MNNSHYKLGRNKSVEKPKESMEANESSTSQPIDKPPMTLMKQSVVEKLNLEELKAVGNPTKHVGKITEPTSKL